MKLWIDADAAPRDVKEIAFRAAQRLSLDTVLVANSRVPVPPHNTFVSTVRVEGGPDVADRYIAETSPSPQTFRWLQRSSTGTSSSSTRAVKSTRPRTCTSVSRCAISWTVCAAPASKRAARDLTGQRTSRHSPAHWIACSPAQCGGVHSLISGSPAASAAFQPGFACTSLSSSAGTGWPGLSPSARPHHPTSCHAPILNPTRRYTPTGSKPIDSCSATLPGLGSVIPAYRL
jgi:hypothetical protein